MGLATHAALVLLRLSLLLSGSGDFHCKRKDARAGRDAEGYRDIGGLGLEDTIPIYSACLALASVLEWPRDFSFL